jgi:hypothetical protein
VQFRLTITVGKEEGTALRRRIDGSDRVQRIALEKRCILGTVEEEAAGIHRHGVARRRLDRSVHSKPRIASLKLLQADKPVVAVVSEEVLQNARAARH